MEPPTLNYKSYRRDCWLGAEISTWDFVLSQGPGNAALLLWMAANAVWAGRRVKKTEDK